MRTGSRSLELIHGFILSQSSAEVASQKVMVFTGPLFKVNKSYLLNNKNSKDNSCFAKLSSADDWLKQEHDNDAEPTESHGSKLN